MTRSELIEAMARAIVEEWAKLEGSDATWHEFMLAFKSPDKHPKMAKVVPMARAEAEAALSAIEQAGLVVAPVEPTQEMMNAGFMRNAQQGGAKRSPEETYAAMIEAGRLK